ncbi:type-F conjugative transfer system mating-pair stabilization protein TraN [Klebsiella oxytoca]|jgi:conjugal transfer mating pair stabilization protein TraN|uniref:type-F conjugative transfer system mating-pair stabilization protein TraN n=1 Tax=Enterobacteriaceae TaxID=543 RepID=UPI00026944E9|nr:MULTISPECIES: type-F conjugative transfer system mating-pair stabilization protein TraN [Enterobacteriaceae]EAN5345587.1 type-F conjugative transfer system mating-pair stabilization protein TraN [Salmonella enterica]ECJ2484552.1 type-F conjugative transfer system mating-pair stabilization protein TraN [Salmonella enterica subsp. houtenae]ECU9003472.1 type-F conjugative transfer system mating-pair stabilization protein TraN [Salmonella enterica subsp. enterica serovar Bareilly]EDC9660913.1 ty
MKRILPLLVATASVFMVQPLLANEQFNQGMQQGKASKGQGADAIQGFKPAEVIPGYTTSPAESGYYGGVTSSGVDMTSPGSAAMNSSEAGKAITESILNTPPDNKPSLDAPFIAEGLAMKDKAETITGGGFDGCVDQPASFTEITTHQCLRDTKIEQYCTRTATIVGDWKETTEIKTYTLTAFSFSRSGKQIVFSVAAPEAGVIHSASLNVTTQNYLWNSRVSFMNTTFNLTWNNTIALGGATGMTLTSGQVLSGTSCSGNGSCTGSLDDIIFKELTGGNTRFTLTLVMQVKSREWVPRVEWSESCPFSKSEGAMTGSQCVEPGGVRTVVVEGKTYSIHQDCWKWQDTYLTQTETEGTCGEYMKDSACTVTRSQCADTVDGFCVSQLVTYSCERKKEGNGQICGGEFFCKDGSCAQGQTGTSNMFGQAVSALAAVAAAGEDVAELNGENVRAFTGEGKSCKKFAAGFNNCCKDSGWGQDVGLSSCSSDEKALGKAKEKKLTVYVGEYCSKKVLGVCLEKKRGYCQFDSKLARIVQEQGRRDQLGVGFGSGKSPDCRGITVDELQRLDFGVMNFSDFYSDLDAGSEIPEDQALLKKAQDIIAEKMKENAP